MPLPERDQGPPRQAEGAPVNNDAPTDHSNLDFTKQHRNATLGGWSPLT
jgi:hypothetical protein